MSFEDYVFSCDKCDGVVKYIPGEFCHVCEKCGTAYYVYEEEEG